MPIAAVVLMETDKCPGWDLSGADLRKRQMLDANLKGTNLSGANLSRSNWHEANLEGANLRGANLSKSDFCFASFLRTDLSNADLSGAIVSCSGSRPGSWFSYANLSGANLKQFDAKTADFSNADLTNTNIEEADFSDAILCNTKTPWGVSRQKIWNSLIYKLRETFGLYCLIDDGLQSPAKGQFDFEMR